MPTTADLPSTVVAGFEKQQPSQSIHSIPPSSSSQSTNQPYPSLTLEQYRALVGIPQEITSGHPVNPTNTPLPPPIRPATITARSLTSATRGPRLLLLLRIFSRPVLTRADDANAAAEYATSLYYTLVREESDQSHLYHFYNTVTYACLILQLVIASALVIIGAISTPEVPRTDTSPGTSSNTFSRQRIAIAVLGAVTGVLTGGLSLLKGQGLPTRLLQYADRLRQVRDKIEFLERTLRADVGAVVTYLDVVALRDEVEMVRNERTINRSDVWATGAGPSKGDSGRAEEGFARPGVAKAAHIRKEKDLQER